MEQGDSPSPAPSNTLNQTDDAFHSRFQQLIQHNAAPTGYAHAEQQSVEIGSQIGSNPHSRYSSPGPQVHMMNAYGHSPINQASPYQAPPYVGGYTAYHIDPSPYPQLPDVGSAATPHHTYSTPATSPPTPVQADGITTRSGRAIMRPSIASTLTRPSRIDKQPSRTRAKKRKRPLGDAFTEPSAILLGDPLSVLVKDIAGIEDTDIEAYVNRSPEDRRREVSQSKTGKVKRPMNAFMLYRKAYQNRTKEWKRLDDIRRKEESASEGKPEKGHDNHQVISQVCGISWNMEPQELRDQYDEWAKVERNNHKLAFPDYKFAPAKSKIKKTGGGEGGVRNDDSDDNASNLDAYDIHEWQQPSSGPPSRNASRSARFMDSESDYMFPPGYPQPPVYTSPSPGVQAARLPYVGQSPVHQQPHPSSFQYSNPGKQRPADYGSTLGQGQYYQQNTEYTQPTYPQTYGGGPYGMHPQGMPAFVENVYINKTNSPGSSFHNSPVLDQHRHPYNELMAASTSYGPQISHSMQHPQPQHLTRHLAEHQIDPSLMSGVGHNTSDTTYENLGILGLGQGGDFAADNLSAYQLDTTGGFGGSHIESPHPQQFEQAYHTPNETTPAAEGGSDAAADTKIGSADWETTLGGTEFQIEDIDQFLGTAADSPRR
ncbi:hypothetical protein EKO27_g538 [Xylaria grammica]|uniref:HMG box domain-containing protein n=1 Tax=Xylaria grammica TaxID=363999 RepID=A0A439DJI6_9PEZI|nr:hypothetical protein EKO27_g538 [Xylaria grammica]